MSETRYVCRVDGEGNKLSHLPCQPSPTACRYRTSRCTVIGDGAEGGNRSRVDGAQSKHHIAMRQLPLAHLIYCYMDRLKPAGSKECAHITGTPSRFNNKL
jgi:hypothetical protein